MNAMRAYLRRVDLVGGYIPQLVMPAERSRIWTLFWYAVRRLDDLADGTTSAAVAQIVHELRHGRGEHELQRAMLAFVEEGAAFLDTRRRALEMLEYLDAERRYLALGDRALAEDAFRLWYHKAYIPAYVGMQLLLLDEDPARVRRYCKLVGAGFQCCDDLFDVMDDLRRGSFWITREELEVLGIRPSQLPARLADLTALREQLCLDYFLAAWDVAAQMSPRNRRLSELAIEQFFRCVLKGRFRVYDGWRKNYYGFLGDALPRIPGPEGVKHALFHRLFDIASRLPVCVGDVGAIRERRARSPAHACPELAPRECLRVMEMVEAQTEPLRPDTGGRCTLAMMS